MEELYKELILELYRHPLNKRLVSGYNAHAQATNPSCGDVIDIFIKFGKDDQIEEVGFQGVGCAISQAAVSLLTEECKGKSRKQLQKMSIDDVKTMLGVTVSENRLNCAALGWKALQKSLTEKI